jgi:hypothetical protein
MHTLRDTHHSQTVKKNKSPTNKEQLVFLPPLPIHPIQRIIDQLIREVQINHRCFNLRML